LAIYNNYTADFENFAKGFDNAAEIFAWYGTIPYKLAFLQNRKNQRSSKINEKSAIRNFVCQFSVYNDYNAISAHTKFLKNLRNQRLVRPRKLLGGGISTPYTPFCLICTIKPELTYFLMCTTIE